LFSRNLAGDDERDLFLVRIIERVVVVEYLVTEVLVLLLL